MARSPGRGKCVHCLTDPVERTWDHVFPRSWYPDSTPSNLEKWQAPACSDCNSRLGKVEEEFRLRAALCLEPTSPESRSIVESARRSIDPSLAKNDADRIHRENKRRSIVNEILVGSAIPDEGVYPGLGERWDRPKEDQVALLFPAEKFKTVSEKIVRGFFYAHSKKFIEDPYKIQFFAINEIQEINATFKRFGEEITRGPGLKLKYAIAEDGISGIYEIELWGQFKLHCSVSKS